YKTKSSAKISTATLPTAISKGGKSAAKRININGLKESPCKRPWTEISGLCRRMAFAKLSRTKKLLLSSLGFAAGGTLFAFNSVSAEELVLHPPKLPWSHNGPLDAFDHASIRRGYAVYKNVCSACHSMKYIYYRHLVGVIFTEEEAKAEAAEIQVQDGPDDEGKMYMRPGRLVDRLPSPYPNDKAARFANNGALPPDLTLINMAREGNEDYIFALLTGYCDPPAGVTLGEGQYFNPYFPGGAIGMAKALYNEIIEYEDGTPATTSQLAKDVSTYLAWSSQVEHDARKRMLVKVVVVGFAMWAFWWWYKRFKWSTVKSRKLIYQPVSKRPTTAAQP
ncbi:unnamed protein product, partial [Cyprideis torosa]